MWQPRLERIPRFIERLVFRGCVCNVFLLVVNICLIPPALDLAFWAAVSRFMAWSRDTSTGSETGLQQELSFVGVFGTGISGLREEGNIQHLCRWPVAYFNRKAAAASAVSLV
jgi:hypothetical protein